MAPAPSVPSTVLRLTWPSPPGCTLLCQGPQGSEQHGMICPRSRMPGWHCRSERLLFRSLVSGWEGHAEAWRATRLPSRVLLGPSEHRGTSRPRSLPQGWWRSLPTLQGCFPWVGSPLAARAGAGAGHWLTASGPRSAPPPAAWALSGGPCAAARAGRTTVLLLAGPSPPAAATCGPVPPGTRATGARCVRPMVGRGSLAAVPNLTASVLV